MAASASEDGAAAIRQRIWQVVHAIPRGRVASYGQVAAQAGLPRGARLVGRVLSQLPPGSALPWHRVVNSRGCISFPEGSPAFREQRQRLLVEGVEFRNGRIPRAQFAWG